MPRIPTTPFRLTPDDLADLERLRESMRAAHGGEPTRADALRYAVRQAVAALPPARKSRPKKNLAESAKSD